MHYKTHKREYFSLALKITRLNSVKQKVLKNTYSTYKLFIYYNYL
jgi:hypothetical protein